MAKTRVLGVRFTDEEREAIDAAATAMKTTSAKFVHDLAVRALGRRAQDAMGVLLEPTPPKRRPDTEGGRGVARPFKGPFPKGGK